MAQTESGWQLEASAPELYERYMVPGIARLHVSSTAKPVISLPVALRMRHQCQVPVVAYSGHIE